MELKNRWASCSPKGNLPFQWCCLMAPRTVLDYIVAHEVVHLLHPNHTEAFWGTSHESIEGTENKTED